MHRQISGGEVGKVEKEEIQETERLINNNIKKRLEQQRDNGREIYLLSLALKELNQLELERLD